MYKKIQQENGEIKQVSKDKLNKILQQLKPMITLLVTILLGSMAIVLIISIFHVYVTTLNVENKSYQTFVRHMHIDIQYRLSWYNCASSGVWSILQRHTSFIAQED